MKQLLSITLPCSEKILKEMQMDDRMAVTPLSLDWNPGSTTYQFPDFRQDFDLCDNYSSYNSEGCCKDEMKW